MMCFRTKIKIKIVHRLHVIFLGKNIQHTETVKTLRLAAWYLYVGYRYKNYQKNHKNVFKVQMCLKMAVFWGVSTLKTYREQEQKFLKQTILAKR